MTNPLIIQNMKELTELLGSDMMEVVFQSRKKRFESFQRVLLCLPPQRKDHQFTQRVLKQIDLRIADFPLLQEELQRIMSQPSDPLWKTSVENQRLFSKVAQLPNMNLLLNGLNLCSNCAGFSRVLKKLDSMSEEVQAQFQQVQSSLVDSHDLYIEYEYDQVLAQHMEMLDCQEAKRPFSEEKMREVVDQEYNLLQLFLNTLQRDQGENQDQIIFSAFSLLSMFTISLKGFLELSYFHNDHTLSDSSFERWMGIYSSFSSQWVIERLQDYGFLEEDLSTNLVDMYYLTMLGQVKEAMEEIEDNLLLMTAFEDSSTFQSYKTFSSQEVIQSIREVYQVAGKGLNQVILLQAYQEAMDQAAL